MQQEARNVTNLIILQAAVSKTKIAFHLDHDIQIE